jgi:hypothetical protein
MARQLQLNERAALTMSLGIEKSDAHEKDIIMLSMCAMMQWSVEDKK